MNRNQHHARGLLAFLMAGSLLAGCTSDASTQPEKKTETSSETETLKKTVQFTDDTGQEFEIESPQSVASLIGSFSDMWILAGGRDSLIASAHDAWTSFDLDLSEDVTDLGGVKAISAEMLQSLQPDLVIASAKNTSQRDLKSLLDSLNIPIAYFDVSDFEDYLRVLKIFTDLNNNPDAYQQYGLSQQSDIEALIQKAQEQTEHPSVLYLRATGKGVSVMNSQDSVLGEMLLDLQAENIADGQSKLQDNLSMETVLQLDPDQIFLVYQGSDGKAQEVMEEQVTSLPAWQSLQAVQKGEVYVMDPSLYNLKPNARWSQAYEQLYQILYE